MAEDTIVVNIEENLSSLLLRIQAVRSTALGTLGTGNIQRGIQTAQRDAEQLQYTLIPVTDQMELMRYELATLGVTDLPGINREMRIILGQIPGMREAMRLVFNIKRLGRGLAGADFTLFLSLLATAIILIKSITQRLAEIERRERERDRWIRQVSGLTREEYDKKLKEWAGYVRSRPG